MAESIATTLLQATKNDPEFYFCFIGDAWIGKQAILLPLVNPKGFFAGVKQLNPADGYWFPEVCAGQEVLKDALLGRWKSSDGTQSCEVRARFAGRVLYETAALGVRRNDPLIAYGTA